MNTYEQDYNNFIHNIKPKMFKITKKELAKNHPDIFQYHSRTFIITNEGRAKELLKKYYIPTMIDSGLLHSKPLITKYQSKSGEIIEYHTHYYNKSTRKPNKYDMFNDDQYVDMIKNINDINEIIFNIREKLTPKQNIEYSYNDLYQYIIRQKRKLFL